MIFRFHVDADNTGLKLLGKYLVYISFGVAVGVSVPVLRWYFSRPKKQILFHSLNRKTATTMVHDQLKPVLERSREHIRNSTLPEKLKTALCRERVAIANPEKVVSHLQKMIAGGIDRFQVVTDFDATLTRYHLNGKRCDTSYGILDTSQMLPSWFREECEKLRIKYHAIEVDPTLSVEEKTPHMEEWWNTAHEALKRTGLRKEWLPLMVKQSSVELREETGHLFEMIDHFKVPLLIYSAGIGDLIYEVLHQRSSFKSFSETPLVVANYMKFNEEGLLSGFGDELIHTFNKHEIFPHHRDYFANHASRTNVILMGDMLGDLRMADGMSARENLVTIGFLNVRIEESMQTYCEKFDIVLLDDQTMEIPINIMESVTGSANGNA